jgi:hypothetical protein
LRLYPLFISCHPRASTAYPSPQCLSRTVSANQHPCAKLTLSNHVSLQDKFPSSAAFDAINEALNASEADKKDAIKQGNAIFAFTLKNAAGETESWHIDLKNTGTVGKGLGEKPTGKITPFELIRAFSRRHSAER